ncbi:hypothetical protein [Brevibacillus massiliensis]|uniref:hypothetical protein n=1 Tax=Brevibacillus massiliensis TaxID=1118054 RepID=UPI0002EE760F|nr:hypothetical protein [Brevibacillus massiliensis]
MRAQLDQVGIKVNLHPTEVTKLTEEFFKVFKYPAAIARTSNSKRPEVSIPLNRKAGGWLSLTAISPMIRKASKEALSKKLVLP